MELEPSTNFVPAEDRRPRIELPPPVQVVAVEDVHLPAPAGLEKQLDEFYVGLLRFERTESPEPQKLVYRAENVSLRFAVTETRPARRDLRATQIIVPNLADLEAQLVQREIDYTRQRGVLPGTEALILLDPAGNWLDITQRREF